MLAKLPDEILWLISRELEDQHDRLHLAISCRRLYGVLYSTVFCKVKLCGWALSESEIGPVSQFFYTIVRNPRLASMVQELNLGSWDTIFTILDRDSPDEFDFDRDLMERLVREATSDKKYREDWIKDLGRGVTDAWLALLIPRLTNLRKISIVWSVDATYVSDMLYEVGKSKTPVFPHLEEAWGAHWDTEMGTDMYMMQPFLKFPALRKLGGFMLCEESTVDEEGNQRNPLKKSEIGCSNITDIDLRMSNAANGLQSWIRACKALRTLRLLQGGFIVSYERTHRGKLYEALSHHKTTLQAISISDDPDGVSDDENEDLPMVSFAEFTSLELLHVPSADLVGLDDEDRPTQSLSDVLPPSLKTLVLTYFDEELLEWLIAQFELLLDSKICPNLESICLESYIFRAPEMVRKAEELKGRLHDSGVSLKTFRYESSDACDYWDSIWPFDHVFNRE